jgi:hypothetical protein
MRLTTPRSSSQDAPGAIDDLYQVLRPEITLQLHQLVEGLHTLVQAAGALAASGHSVRGYDGEPSSTASPNAGRAGAGINRAELERLWRRLQPLAVPEMPLETPPPRTTRFGSPLVLSRAHWVRPELVAEVKYLTWTGDKLLRQVVYEGLREDKPAAKVRRSALHPKP